MCSQEDGKAKRGKPKVYDEWTDEEEQEKE